MKVEIERCGFKILFESEKEPNNKVVKKIIESADEIIRECLSGNIIPAKNADNCNIIPLKNVSTVTGEAPETKIRERLPNSVDIKDLDIKQAVKESALVRCPNCGQSHVLVVRAGNSMYIMRKDYAKKEFVLILELEDGAGLSDMVLKDGVSKKDYFDDIQGIHPMDDKDFAVDDDTEIFCPVCKKSSSFHSWKDAYENPLHYFETEHLCDACGGETVDKILSNKKIIKCEKCGLERNAE